MKIMVTGISGRMGAQVAHAVLADEGTEMVSAPLHEESLQRRDIGEVLGMSAQGVLTTSLEQADFTKAQAVIDFTLPEALLIWLEGCVKAGVPFVTGTTGLSEADQRLVEQAAKQIPIVQSFNMSLGVNLLAALVEQAAAKLDESFDIEIHEIHHRHKKDSPSGTALLLGEAAAKGRKVPLKEKKAIDRDGVRKAGDIGFSVQRGGGVIGDHSVALLGENERIELNHIAHNRRIYADGALKAAKWVQDKPAGLYSMRDVLGV